MTSLRLATGSPSTAVIRSPGCSFSALGPDSTTDCTRGSSVTFTPPARRAATVALPREESIIATASLSTWSDDLPGG